MKELKSSFSNEFLFTITDFRFTFFLGDLLSLQQKRKAMIASDFRNFFHYVRSEVSKLKFCLHRGSFLFILSSEETEGNFDSGVWLDL